MATGENFMRIHFARRNAEKAAATKNVDKAFAQKAKAEIAKLQKKDNALWADLTLDDDIVEQQSREYNNRIRELIELIY